MQEWDKGPVPLSHSNQPDGKTPRLAALAFNFIPYMVMAGGIGRIYLTILDKG